MKIESDFDSGAMALVAARILKIPVAQIARELAISRTAVIRLARAQGNLWAQRDDADAERDFIIETCGSIIRNAQCVAHRVDGAVDTAFAAQRESDRLRGLYLRKRRVN